MLLARAELTPDGWGVASARSSPKGRASGAPFFFQVPLDFVKSGRYVEPSRNSARTKEKIMPEELETPANEEADPADTAESAPEGEARPPAPDAPSDPE